MRALHMGDPHIGKLIRGRSRNHEHSAIIGSFLAAADEHKPDYAVIPGDLFDNANPGPDELELAGGLLRGLRDREIKTIVTPGNHDGPFTLQAERGKVTTWLKAFGLPLTEAMSEPGLVMFDHYKGPIFFTLPYPHKRSFDSLLDKSLRDRTEEVSKALENIIETMLDQLTRQHPGVPLYFVSHLSTLNAELSEDQAMRMGWDVTIRKEVLDGFTGAFLGHIHRPQEVTPGRVWYSGSPFYGDFGETTQTKGFLLWDQPGESVPTDPATVTLIPSEHLPMRRLDLYESLDWTGREGDPINPRRDFNGWLQIRLFPDQGGTPSWQLKRDLKAMFPEAAGVFIETQPRPPQQRQRITVEQAEQASDPLAITKTYLELHGLPTEPTLEVARDIMTTVDGG